MHALCATSHTCREFKDSWTAKVVSDKLEACYIYSPLWMLWTILMTAQSTP